MTVRVRACKGPNTLDYFVRTFAHVVGPGAEPPGRWLGTLSARWGLGVEVDTARCAALIGATGPVGPIGALGRPWLPRGVRCFEVVAAAPKSVSVLYALGTAPVVAQVLAAHERAVEDLVAVIEARTSVRLGEPRRRPAGCELVVAAYRHHRSRADDPHLHSHLLVLNRAQDPDGAWRVLASRSLFRDQTVFTGTYQACLRRELTARLGLAWRPVVHGRADLEGMPTAWLEEFSQRRREVQARAGASADFGGDALARHAATRGLYQRQRPRRDPTADLDTWRAAWSERARRRGMDAAGALVDLLDLSGRRDRPATATDADLRSMAREAGGGPSRQLEARRTRATPARSTPTRAR
jgi:conjugative relaxase-like TrwC/TraI family protein